MAENKYRRYLDSNRPASQYTQRLHEPQDEGISRKLIAGGAGLGLLAFAGYKAGLLQKPANMLFKMASGYRGDYVGAIGQGVGEWLRDSPKVLDSLMKIPKDWDDTKSLLKQVPNNVRDSISVFKNRLGSALDTARKASRDPLIGRADIVDELIRREREKLGVRSAIKGKLKKDQFFGDIQKQFGEDVASRLQHQMSDLPQVKYLNYKNLPLGRYAGEFQTPLFEDVKEYTSRMRNRLTSRNRGRLHQLYSGAMRNYDESLRKDYGITDKTEKFLKSRRNMRQATLADLRERGYLDEIVKLPTHRGGHREMALQDMVEEIGESTEDVWNFAAGPGIYIDEGTDDIIDLRAWRRLGRQTANFLDNFKIPIVNIKPTQLFKLDDINDRLDMPRSTIIDEAEMIGEQSQKILRARGARPAPMMMLGDTAKYLMDPDAEGISGLARASRHDTTVGKQIASMLGYTARELPESRTTSKGWLGLRNKFLDTFDLGRQETPSIFERFKSVGTKFDNEGKMWVGSAYAHMMDDSSPFQENLDELGHPIKEFLYKQTTSMDSQTFELYEDTINEMLDQIARSGDKMSFNDFAMNTREEIVDALHNTLFGKGMPHNQTRADMMDLWQKYVSDPEGFMRGTRRVGNKSAIDFTFLNMDNTKDVDRIDQVKKLVQQELVMSATERKGIDPFEVLEQAHRKHQITTNQYRRAKDMLFENVAHNLDSGEGLKGLLRRPSNYSPHLSGHMEDIMKRKAPWHQLGKLNMPNTFFGQHSGVVVYNKKRKLPSGRDFIESINDATKREATLKQTKDYFKQFTAGRKNPGDITTSTLFPYYYFNRLNQALSGVGLALSPDSLGSTQDVAKNLFLKRYMLVWGAVAGAGFADFAIEGITGVSPKHAFADTVAGAHMGLAHTRDFLGITDWAERQQEIMSGSEMLWEMPGGSFLDPTQSAEDVEEYYLEGEDPIRKGRWWPLGNTPFQGGKVEYFAPNWYRRAKSDWQYTDTLYGSKAEYWLNGGPIGWTPWDPYHWEKKHKDRRPYPVTGDIPFLQNIPIVGPIASATVGGVLKPKVKMHQKEIESVMAATQNASSQKISPETYAYVTSSGRIQLKQYANATGGSGGDTGGSGGGGLVSAVSGAISSPLNLQSGQSAVISGTPLFGGSGAIQAQKPGPGQLVRASGILPNTSGSGGEQVTIPEGVRSASSAPFRLGETYYSVTEIGGIYGYMATQVTGDIQDDYPVWQNASDMTSYSRQFWDMSIGGFDFFTGDISEIGRRFIPRERTDIEEINPIRNTMPEWMPGPEYFDDFKHGDPYVKIKRGEIRLPGEAYESINELHPDELGRYGKFDRFKILADVAPYSKQYKYYRDLVTHDPNMTEDMRSEATEIKKQVAARKEKRRLFDYNFVTADIKKQNVTVTKVLDNNTFLTREYPDNPIRLAGAHVPSGRSKEAQQARDFLKDMIAPGKRVKIGVTSDEVNLYEDDQLKTIRATVYKGMHSMQREMIEKGLAKEKKDDYSPAGIHARFTRAERMQGALWERFAHYNTPFHTKFLQVRSPLESYRRRDLYGKDWQSWDNPIRDFLIPTVESYSTKFPAVAAGLGYFFGSRFGATPAGRRIGGLIGGAVIGGMSVKRWLHDITNKDRWIPKRREKERDINEYFDKLKYLKYKGLYEKAKDKAKKEGFNVERYVNKQERLGKIRKRKIEKLEKRKRNIIKSGKERAHRKEISKINSEIKELRSYKEMTKLTPWAARALQYKEMYESTLYGADPYGDMTKIFRALPKKDRMYFSEFLEASPSERKEIIRLVPDNQKRFYQARWGMKVDKRKSLKKYFKDHYLPGSNWEGWRAGKSVQDLKVKVINEQDMELTQFGFWEDDLEKAERNNTPYINIFKDTRGVRRKLRNILEGAGLGNVSIDIVPADTEGVEVEMDITQDTGYALNSYVNEHANELF